MADEKDRFGGKLHNIEKAREDQWARQRDAELLDKIRHKHDAALRCPKCGKELIEKTAGKIAMLACPADDGAWLDAAALKNLPKS